MVPALTRHPKHITQHQGTGATEGEHQTIWWSSVQSGLELAIAFLERGGCYDISHSLDGCSRAAKR